MNNISKKRNRSEWYKKYYKTPKRIAYLKEYNSTGQKTASFKYNHSKHGKEYRKIWSILPTSKYAQYKKTAKQRGIEFGLSIQQFMKYWGQPCSYCGKGIATIGIDRVDNKKGYIEGNIAPCCYTCNTFKMDRTASEFTNHCADVVAYQSNKIAIIPEERMQIYMNMAKLIAKRGTCDRAQVGAVIVSRSGDTAYGYNGSARGDLHCNEAGHLLENGHCIRTIHAEENAIINASKNGISTLGGVLFCTHMPCLRCCQRLTNAGIGIVYYDQDYGNEDPNRDALLKRVPLLVVKC